MKIVVINCAFSLHFSVFCFLWARRLRTADGSLRAMWHVPTVKQRHQAKSKPCRYNQRHE